MKKGNTITARLLTLALLPCVAACSNADWARYPKKKDNQYAKESWNYSKHYKTRDIGYIAFNDSEDPEAEPTIVDVRRVGKRYSLSTPIAKSEEEQTGFVISSRRGKDLRAGLEWRLNF